MRVAIVNFTGGSLSGGYEKYLKNLLPRIARNSKIEALMVVNPSSVDTAVWHKSIHGTRWIEFSPYLGRIGKLGPRTISNIKKFNPDVMFLPTARYFQLWDIPVVVLVQNMEPMLRYGHYTWLEKIRLQILKRATAIAVQKADRVIVASHFVEDYLCQHLGIAKDKVSLIYYGADIQGGNRDNLRPQKLPTTCRNNFIFTAGPIRPYKGFEDAIHAMGYLSRQGIRHLSLIIAGNVPSGMVGYRKKLDRLVMSEGIFERVFWLGKINEYEMNWCFKHCQAFLMTSRIESFGNVAVEAMSHGCICVAADNPCLPEIFGDAAVYYPPNSGERLGSVIQCILNWPPAEKSLASERAKLRASEFSWDLTTEQTVTQLELAVKQKHS